MMQCRICGNRTNNTRYQAREMMFGMRDTFNYFQCQRCKCLQIETVPDTIAQYYPVGYNGHQPPRQSYFAGLKGAFRKKRYAGTLFHTGPSAAVMARLFPAEQYRLLGKLPLTTTTRILDVGCGMGNFLYPLYELGMKNVSGVDPFIESSIKYPNGYTVEKKYIHELDGTWEVILYNHSFEHVPDPLENLQSVAKRLTPGGTCIIRIPTVSSFAWEHYRTNWFQLDAPRHFFLHSVESIQLLAHQAGLALVEVIYDSTEMQFINSEKYIKDIPMEEKDSKGFMERKVQKWRYQRKAKQLNAEKRGDQAAFFLQRAVNT